MNHLLLHIQPSIRNGTRLFTHKYLIVSVILLTFSSCQSNHPVDKPWSKTYTDRVFRQMDSAETQRIPDKIERRRILNFMIERFKRDLPKGIESVGRDSFKTIVTNIGLEYAHQMEPDSIEAATVGWSSDVEQQIRDGFSQGYKATGPDDLNEKCDCVIKKLKKMYPDSLTVPLSDKVMAQVAGSCF